SAATCASPSRPRRRARRRRRPLRLRRRPPSGIGIPSRAARMSLGSPGRLALLAAGALLFADLFLAWQKRCVRIGATEHVCADRAGWYGFGIAVGLATTVLVVWVAAQLVGVDLPRIEPALAVAVLVL